MENIMRKSKTSAREKNLISNRLIELKKWQNLLSVILPINTAFRIWHGQERDYPYQDQQKVCDGYWASGFIGSVGASAMPIWLTGRKDKNRIPLAIHWPVSCSSCHISLISIFQVRLSMHIHLLCPLQPLILLQEPHMEQYLYAVRIALDAGTLLLGRWKILQALFHLRCPFLSVCRQAFQKYLPFLLCFLPCCTGQQKLDT